MPKPNRHWPPLLFVSVVAFTGLARAEDSWTDPYPGVRCLRRAEPHRIYHVITVQLNHRDLSVRATAPDERGRTTVAFAKHVGAAVAINGDAFTTPEFIPRGWAVGDGRAWPRKGPAPADHAFIACNAQKACKIDRTRDGKAPGAEWTNVVGGDSALLIRDGVVRSATEDTRCGSACLGDRARSAVGLDKAGSTLFLLAAERGGRERKGPTLREVATVLASLGAHRAVSLDGGAISSLVLSGKRVNPPPPGKREAPPAANHLAVLYRPPPDGCSLAKRMACGKYGCSCVADQCNGGICPGDGCTPELRARCASYGCTCVDMQCNGGFCPGSGCTLRTANACAKKGCGCVDGKCAGGQCRGSACTAKQIAACSKFGCACAAGKCAGGFCAGSGCEIAQENECAKFGCTCVDGKCAGGYCAGTGCTPKQAKTCDEKGCSCVDGACSGGRCPGSGCTAKMIVDCTRKGCGCANGQCEGGRCPSRGCGCQLAAAPSRASDLPLVALLLLTVGAALFAGRALRRR